MTFEMANASQSSESGSVSSALEQAILIRKHVTEMREHLECSALYLAEAKRTLDTQELPRPV